MKKIIGLISVVFTILTVLVCTLSAFAINYTIVEGETIFVTGESSYYTPVMFKPSVSGTYKLTFNSDDIFYVNDENDHYYVDDNMQIELKLYLLEGEEYRYNVKASGDWEDANAVRMSVTLLCTHANKTVTPGKDFTCTEDGYSEKIVCDDCSSILKDSFVAVARHIDTDNDYYCDLCGVYALLVEGNISITGNGYNDYEGVTKIDYKLYANGDLYIDGFGMFKWYDAQKLKDLFSKYYDSFTGEYTFRPRNVYVGKDINYLLLNYGAERYVVDPENKTFSSDSYGVLFSKDGKTLIEMPSEYKDASYTIPSTVEMIDEYSFVSAKNLRSVTIPSSVKYISSQAFNFRYLTCEESVDGLIYIGDALVDEAGDRLEVVKIREGTRVVAENIGVYDDVYVEIPASVEVISGDLPNSVYAYNVDPNNNYFSSLDGVLFNKDKSVLIKYPSLDTRTSYSVPVGVKEIAKNAFNSDYLRELNLVEGIEIIRTNAISADNVPTVAIPKSLKRIEFGAIFVGLNGAHYYDFGAVFSENIEYIGEYAIYCSRIAVLNPNCVIESNQWIESIYGYKGSTAETTVIQDYSIEATFYPLDGLLHKHADFGVLTKAPTCTEAGEVVYSCPCGKNKPHTEEIYSAHHFDYGVECLYCGIKNPFAEIYDGNCRCMCHDHYKSRFHLFIITFRVLIWRFFGINEVCRCGDYIHYGF